VWVVLVLVALGALLSLYFLIVLVGAVLALVPWLVLGLIAGWVADKLMGDRFGLVGDLLIGLAGSVIGTALYTLLTGHRPGGPFGITHLIVAIIGAVLLLAVLGALGRRTAA
jgi:uncharacterized membrane protein YeaQ/YmgE (transglycosylase-associated protein family)